MATKKQSRPKVKGVVNPKGITQVFGTPIDFKALPEKISINRRLSNGKFKLEAHYPAKHYNDKQNYIGKRKEGSYCRFYDNKSPFFIARTVWDAASQPGMHMMVKNRGETHRFIVTPKVDDPTKASVIGSYLVHRDNGDPVLCSGVIGELEAVGDDGDFKVIPYKNHGIRCPKFDSDKNELAGHIPKTFEYKKSTKPRGPRKTAADYCKPKHSFKHPTDIKKAEMVAAMDDELEDEISCLECAWDGTYEDLIFIDADGGGGYDFVLACPLCESDEWLDDMMEAEGYDEPCFSCDGMGAEGDEDCSYCEGSGLMSDTLRAEMALYDSEYFDADCGCFKKKSAESEDKFEAPYAGAGYPKPFFWNGMPENEFITKSGEVAEWIMQYEYGPIENWWVWQGDGPEDPDDPDEWGYVDTGAEGLYLGVTMFIRKLNGYPYDEVPIENLDIDDRLNVWGGHSMKGLWTNEPTISEDYDSLIFEAPYAGAGSLMGIKGDSALSSFTTSELTESSAIHGDFDQASLNYSGHQNLEVRAEAADLSFMDWAKQEEASHLKKYGAEGKKNCGCGKDPCITYGAEGSGEITKKVKRRLPFDWETEPHPHEHDDLIDDDYVNEEMEGVMGEAFNDGNTDSWISHTHYTTDEDGKDVEIEVSGVFRAEHKESEEAVYIKVKTPKNRIQKGLFYQVGQEDEDGVIPEKIVPIRTMNEHGRKKLVNALDKMDAESAFDKLEDEVPHWAKPLGLIGGLAAGYISAKMIGKRSDIK